MTLYDLVGSFDAPSMMDDDDDEDEEEMMMEGGRADDFRERTAWQSKHEAKSCFGCGAAFNPLTNRHHHCRACGRVVCGACSPHKDAVKGYKDRVRTCTECHDDLAAGADQKRALWALVFACPCFRWARKEVNRQKHAALVRTGAVFVKRASKAAKLRSAATAAAAFFGAAAPRDDAGDAATTRCRVSLRPDGAALAITSVDGDDDADPVYLHDVRAVEARGGTGLALVGADGAVLFEGSLVDERTRDAWLAAVKALARDAASKPPPSKHDARPKSRVQMAARSAKREIELQTRKRDAEKRKAEYLKGVGGGLKYTAVAMANRASGADVV